MSERFKRMVDRLRVARDAHIANVRGYGPGGLVTISARDLEGHAALLSEAAAIIEERGKPTAWRYELAKARYLDGSGYCEWEWCLTDFKPNVPEGSMRNLTPLYYLED